MIINVGVQVSLSREQCRQVFKVELERLCGGNRYLHPETREVMEWVYDGHGSGSTRAVENLTELERAAVTLWEELYTEPD